MDAIAIPNVNIVKADKLAEKRAEVIEQAIPLPFPSDRLDRPCLYQCTIKNCTQFRIYFHKAHFEIGGWREAPTAIQPFSQMIFTATNSVPRAKEVIGGATFRLRMDLLAQFDFTMGLEGHMNGKRRVVGVVEAGDPMDGCGVTTGKITSEHRYRGKDEDNPGKLIDVEFHLTAMVFSGEGEVMIIVEQIKCDIS